MGHPAQGARKPRTRETTIEFGLHLHSANAFGGTLAGLLEAASVAEAGGFACLSVQDHLRPYPQRRNPQELVPDPWVLLGTLAARTRNCRLLPLVLNTSLRAPARIAKAAATLDGVSGGRLVLGLGTGGYGGDHEALGVPAISGAARAHRLADAVDAVRAAWSPARPEHPKPVAPPPILIGGASAPVLEIAARSADLVNFAMLDAGECASRLGQLNRRRLELGITGTLQGTLLARIVAAPSSSRAQQQARQLGLPAQFVGDRDGLAEQFEAYERVGITTVFAMFDDTGSFEAFNDWVGGLTVPMDSWSGHGS